MTGFEIFWGGGGDDRFRDGPGNQTYRGRGGNDVFEFLPGQAGADRIEDFDAGDVIDLRGLGPALGNFNAVLAASRQLFGGVQIDTSPNSSILLLGAQLFNLQPTDFLF
jgi:hypothetical protein